MRRPFHIEQIGNPEKFADLMKDKSFLHRSLTIKHYSNQALIYEDFRTVIELNKTIEDLLSDKYFFLKFKGVDLLVDSIHKDVEAFSKRADSYNTLLIQSLFTTSVVTYTKWFTNSSGGKKTKLEAKEVFKNCTKSILNTHQKLMDYRNLYFAHSGPTSLEETYPILFQDFETNKDFLTFFPTKKRIPALTEVKRFHKLFLKAIEHVYNKMELMKPKVIEEVKIVMSSR